MAKQTHAQLIDARAAGRKIVFAKIRSFGPIARVDIAKDTGLSPATVTSITAELLASELIIEKQANSIEAVSKRGRPRLDLKIRSDAHIVAGIKVSDRSVSLTFLNFAGEDILNYELNSPKEAYKITEFLHFLDNSLNEGLAKLSLQQKHLSGIGLAIPGIVDPESGVALWSPILSEKYVDLKQRLSDWFNMPVFVDNDANMVALAEHHAGCAQTHRNFAVVTVEQGVGMGLFLDNKIFRGQQGAAGELGHTKVHLDGAICRCGQRGCLEAYVGDFALLQEATIKMGEIKGANTQEKMTNLLAAAEKGDLVAQSVIQKGGRVLAMGIANVISLFGPELIVLTGERVQEGSLFSKAILEDIKRFTLQYEGVAPEIKFHQWDNRMWSFGAAYFALDGVIDLCLAAFQLSSTSKKA